jgi:hypothetical protein
MQGQGSKRKQWECYESFGPAREMGSFGQFPSEEPRSQLRGSSIPKEEEFCNRLLTPKQASGNPQTLGLNII